jgi:hypothetical protein
MYIYPLSRIHNTSLVSAYFGLDKRECECLEYISAWKLIKIIVKILTLLVLTKIRNGVKERTCMVVF